MPEQLTAYRVFIASPGGLIPERKAFHKVIADYNQAEAVPRGVSFIPVGWEETLGGVGRPQALINEDIHKCDYFVLLLHARWGSPSESGPDAKYTSGTEEEYGVAWACFEDDDSPMRQIVAVFKAVDPERLADPGDQLKKVLEFTKKLEQEKKLLFHTFDELGAFENCLRAHLGQWLRDHESGSQAKMRQPEPLPTPSPPAPEPELVEPSEKPPTDDLLDEAERQANEGKLVEAEANFAKAITRGDDPAAFNRYGHFLRRVGRFAQAEVMYERILELSDLADAESWQAAAFGNLGLIYQARGDLDQAEQMHRKSLAIEEKLGRLGGMAADYGNLGLIYRARDDLDQAEQMHRKSLEIYEKAGDLAGMAIQFGNLGLIHETRGDLDESEQMHRKALDIDEKLGVREGVARHCGNLGVIHEARRDLKQAEQMYRKALEINEKLGRKQGIAIQYFNLGQLYEMRGDQRTARDYLLRARDLFERIGMPKNIERVQSLLDKLPPESDTDIPPD